MFKTGLFIIFTNNELKENHQIPKCKQAMALAKFLILVFETHIIPLFIAVMYFGRHT